MAHKYAELTKPLELDKHSFAQFNTENPKYETVTPKTTPVYNLDSLAVYSNALVQVLVWKDSKLDCGLASHRG